MDSITTSRTSNGAVTTYAAAGWRVAVMMPDTDEERWTLKVYVPGAVTIYLYEEDGGWARDAGHDDPSHGGGGQRRAGADAGGSTQGLGDTGPGDRPHTERKRQWTSARSPSTASCSWRAR
jgi:hypothetical protein